MSDEDNPVLRVLEEVLEHSDYILEEMLELVHGNLVRSGREAMTKEIRSHDAVAQIGEVLDLGIPCLSRSPDSMDEHENRTLGVLQHRG